MKRNAIRTAAALMTTTVVMGALCSCNYETPETTTSLAPGQTTAQTIDLSDQSFETAYGSQLIGYLDHQYYFQGEAIPIAESNFYFIDAFSELTNYAQYYGLYPMTAEGWIDLSAPVTADIENEEVDGDADLYANYGEFFVVYAERMLESTYIINSLAREKGLELSEEQLAEIDDIINNSVTPSATAAGMTNDEFLQLYYGPSCTEADFRNILYNYKLAELYTDDYIENYEFAEEDIMVPNTRYALFWAPEEETDEETMAEQEALANELLEQCVDAATGELSLDLFEVYGTFSASQYEEGEPGAYQFGDEFAVSRGAVVPAYEEWAYAEEREEGDIEIIYAPEYGYFVVGYLGTTEVDDSTKDQLAVDAMSEEVLALIDEGSYDFYTDMEFTAAEPVVATTAESSATSGIGLTAAESGTKLNAKDVITGVLAVIGGIAVIALAVFGIGNAMKKPQAPSDDNEENNEGEEPASEGSDETSDEDEDNEEN